MRSLREQQLELSEKRRQQIIRLRRKGLTLAQIGNRYGISRQRVRQIIGPDEDTP